MRLRYGQSLNSPRNLNLNATCCNTTRSTTRLGSLPIANHTLFRASIIPSPGGTSSLQFSTQSAKALPNSARRIEFGRIPNAVPRTPHHKQHDEQYRQSEEDDISTRKLNTAFILILSVCHVAYYADYASWMLDARKLAGEMKQNSETAPHREITSTMPTFEKTFIKWVTYRIEDANIQPIAMFNSNFANLSLLQYVSAVAAVSLLTPPLCRLYGPLKVFAMFAVGGTAGSMVHWFKNKFDVVYDKFHILDSMLEKDELSPTAYKWAVVLLPPSPDLWEGVYSGSSTAIISLATIACFVVPQLRIALPFFPAQSLALRPLLGAGFLHDTYRWEGKRLGGYVSGFLIWVILLRKGRFQRPRAFF
ncbi:hypothetical protein BJ508DRAFT_410324 [Ascobolus immersus RN42]|uniref:Uncharacterized protein n=1 Tax=Ascobolus immersus RN42 TaxID=1160509 RepID=A0A3N4ITP4_ASCIM|nr:hypothetical protein BJ508DRAFT_410324 [Ascobolus immersus RN42]